MYLDINEKFYLTNPESTELEECLGYVVEVSEGLLGKIFNKVDINKALMLISGEDSPIFNCDNIHVIKDKTSGKIVSMLLGYKNAGQSLPLILRTFISKEKIKLLEQVLCFKYEESYYINTLYVAPEYRGLGFATLLLDIAQILCKQFDIKSMVLHCFKENTNALSMYQKYGFEIVDTFKYACLKDFAHQDAYICQYDLDKDA